MHDTPNIAGMQASKLDKRMDRPTTHDDNLAKSMAIVWIVLKQTFSFENNSWIKPYWL